MTWPVWLMLAWLAAGLAWLVYLIGQAVRDHQREQARRRHPSTRPGPPEEWL